MFEQLSDDLLDLTVAERGRGGISPLPAIPICCSIVISLCSSCSSREEAE